MYLAGMVHTCGWGPAADSRDQLGNLQEKQVKHEANSFVRASCERPRHVWLTGDQDAKVYGPTSTG